MQSQFAGCHRRSFRLCRLDNRRRAILRMSCANNANVGIIRAHGLICNCVCLSSGHRTAWQRLYSRQTLSGEDGMWDRGGRVPVVFARRVQTLSRRKCRCVRRLQMNRMRMLLVVTDSSGEEAGMRQCAPVKRRSDRLAAAEFAGNLSISRTAKGTMTRQRCCERSLNTRELVPVKRRRDHCDTACTCQASVGPLWSG